MSEAMNGSPVVEVTAATRPGSMMTATASDEATARRVASCLDGLSRIAEARLYQVIENGYGPEVDDAHSGGELLDFASQVLFDVMTDARGPVDPSWRPAFWWEGQAARVVEKHGGDRLARLAIVGALVAAEIDRLERAKGGRQE